MRYFIYSYNRKSKGARALKRGMVAEGHRVLLRDNTPLKRHQLRPRATDLVINWGNSNDPPNWSAAWGYNSSTSIRVASNKLLALNDLRDAGVAVPRFTTDIEEAKAWGTWVVCRRLLRASEGRGIVLAKTPEEVVRAPLYVQFRRKTNEYRVHVVNGTIRLSHEKRLCKRENRPVDYNPHICNHSNAWKFCKVVTPLPECVKENAIKAVEALHLNFGAVDIIYNKKFDTCYVLEVNTAPGFCEGSETQQAFVRAFTNA